MKHIINIFLVLFSINTVMSQVPVPAKSQERSVLLVNATVHVGNGELIEKGAIGFDNGIIRFVGSSDNVPGQFGSYQRIDLQGQHIYPGFILPNTQLGLSEVSAVNATNDQAETGSINPNIRSVISYNTDSENIPAFRYNGILLAEATPTGGTVSGTSSVMELDGWNWEDATHSPDVAMHLNWPAKMSRQFDFATFTVSENPNKNYDKDVANLQKHFLDAKAYKMTSAKETNLKMEAMLGLFSGEKVLMIHAGGAKECIEAIQFSKEVGVKNVALVGNQHMIPILGFLKKHNIGVVLPPVHSLPGRPDYDVLLPYKLPAILHENGITVALSHSGMLANARNLPFYAGTAAAYGLDKEEALKCITSNPAKILGIDDRVGTLEVGKEATLIVSIGDALDMRTNHLNHAFIRGKEIQLKGRQQELYERYSRKYGQMK